MLKSIPNIHIKNRVPILILLIYILISTVGINGSIYILDEAKNTECAREMLESENYIVPTFNYELRTDKPPLHYFFMALSYKIFGVSSWSSRFFSIIFGALTLLITYFFAKKWLGIKTAYISSLILLSSLHYGIFFHMAVPDPYLVFFFTASLFLFFESLQSRNRLIIWGMYICLSLGVLTKGPIAVLFPGLIMLVYLLITKNFNLKSIARLKPFEGLIIFSLIVLPWYLLVDYKTNGEWTRGFFMEHNMERFSSTKEGHGFTFLMTPLFVFFGLFPFSLFLFRSINHIYKQKKEDVLIFALTAGLVILIFFTLSSTRLPNYTAPAYPFFAVLIASFLAKIKQFNPKPELIGLIILSILLLATAYIGLTIEKQFTVLIPQLLLLTTGFIGAVFALKYYKKKKFIFVIHLISYSFIIFSFFLSGIIFQQIAKQNPVSMSLPLIDKNEPIAYYKKFNPSYPFYLKCEIKQLDNIESLKYFLENHPKACVISTLKSLRDVNYQEFALKIFEQKDVFENRTTVILMNKKRN
ncbi:dolichyl-phosphate-mannose-protein mannosyltransferase [Ancylomarina subtilis]|uniref:Dolichyl-phosphate-mannose-protein mannosyltransferase n=1 Tax=Ancylomarina subtilis TaxID=1639035 RepID=A0A4Q7VHV4_9BACT|nr:glycosyltransferase family 39 protein [Ancylomarina subtilis]RZT95508.1 dolichyl-phosphate-mannose-protein mannosyltransferase [Ancylomarina subtilis]